MSIRNIVDPRLHLFLLALGLVSYKFYLLEINSRAIFGCHWCLTSKAIFFELQFVILLGTLHLLSAVFRWFWMRCLLRLIVVIFLVIMITDLLVLQQFLVRLTLYGLFKFAGETHAIIDFIRQFSSSPWNIIVLIAVPVGILWVFKRYLLFDRVNAPPAVFLACIGVSLLGIEYLKPIEYHTPYLQNSIEAFFSSETRNQPYSEDFFKTIPNNSTKQGYCFEGQGERPDLILLMVESLSMYHSALFSGINNWMPQFDNESQRGRWFSNFYANGVNTEQGLVALHIGEPPIVKGIDGKAAQLYEQFQNSKNTLPRMLNALGYHTIFLTPGNLGFLGKGNWLKNIGYDYIEGHDAPHYDGMKRFHFDAAPDSALYERALQALKAHSNRENTPIFMALETVSTHHPYIDPDSGQQSEELAFRYADRQLGSFLENLRQSRFFDNGYLMIVSDHRVMVPINQTEMDRFGKRAYARIPFAILGHGFGGEEVANQFSQSDLLPSLRYWLSEGSQCVSSNQGIFLPKSVHTPACVFTHRSYNLDNIFIHCGNNDYTVNLDGDHTRYIDSNEPATDLLNEIHRLRLDEGY